MNEKTMESTRVVTGKNCVLGYLNVNRPRIPFGGGDPEFSACVIVPKTDIVTVEKINAAIMSAYIAGQVKLADEDGVIPSYEEIKKPLRDGDAERGDDPAYRGAWFFNAKTKVKPLCVDARRQPILKTSELYSGIIGRVLVGFYAFHHGEKRGIACSLLGLQKLADGKPLGYRFDPEVAFADEE